MYDFKLKKWVHFKFDFTRMTRVSYVWTSPMLVIPPPSSKSITYMHNCIMHMHNVGYCMQHYCRKCYDKCSYKFTEYFFVALCSQLLTVSKVRFPARQDKDTIESCDNALSISSFQLPGTQLVCWGVCNSVHPSVVSLTVYLLISVHVVLQL